MKPTWRCSLSLAALGSRWTHNSAAVKRPWAKHEMIKKKYQNKYDSPVFISRPARMQLDLSSALFWWNLQQENPLARRVFWPPPSPPSDPSKRGANRSTCVRCDHVARAPHWPRQGTHLKSARNVAFPPARRMRKKNRAGFRKSGNELAVSLIPGLRNSFPFFFVS